VQGKEIVAPPAEEMPHVINIMEALRKSLEQTEQEKGCRGEAGQTGGQERSKKAGGEEKEVVLKRAFMLVDQSLGDCVTQAQPSLSATPVKLSRRGSV